MPLRRPAGGTGRILIRRLLPDQGGQAVARGRSPGSAPGSGRHRRRCRVRPWARRPPPVKLTDSGRYRFPLPFNEQTVADIVNNRARKQLVAAPNAGTAVGVSMREAYLLHSIVAVGMRNCIDHADEVDRRSTRLLSAMEPLLIVMMFLMIGSLLLSIMIPLLKLSSQVG